MERLWDWIVDQKVIACAYPGNLEALAELADSGVRLCINLREWPLPTDMLRQLGLVELHLPVPDFTAPPPEVLRKAVEAIDQAHAARQAVAVNCAAGLGRTGTVVAAWLVAHGATAAEAIREVRARRPGSVESAEQVAAIHAFAESVSPHSDNG
jgi:atypical dual specificity phosphatase